MEGLVSSWFRVTVCVTVTVLTNIHMDDIVGSIACHVVVNVVIGCIMPSSPGAEVKHA